MTDVKRIDPAELRRRLHDGGEIAVVDVREEGAFTAADHLLYASSLPLSRLELSAPDLLPRRDVRLVAVDGDETLAPRAARRLAELGYADVSVLTGGVTAWKAAGFPVYRGAHVPSKAFAELVEHLDGTPWIDIESLRAKQAAGEDLAVLDTRSFPEYRNQTIPGAISAPGVEIVDVVRDLVPSPDTLVVASCGGRTRSIIGAQALIAAGLPNRVVSLQNGTMGWTLAGLSVEKGAQRRAGPPGPTAREWSRAAAERLAERYNIPTIDAATLALWRADPTRTLHLFDVRQPEEFERGHIPGFVSVAGGQLVQETDRHVATLGARIVLADDGSLARARITAHWLIRQGWDVAVLDGAVLKNAVQEIGPRPARALGLEALAEAPDDLLTPEALNAALQAGAAVVVDVALSSDYRRGHIPGSWFSTRARLGDNLKRLPKADRVAIASPDGALARLAAAELRAQGVAAAALDGGSRAWVAAGLPLDKEPLYAETPDDVWLPPRLAPDPEAAMRDYLTWEIDLVHQIPADPDFRFIEREALSRHAAA